MSNRRIISSIFACSQLHIYLPSAFGMVQRCADSEPGGTFPCIDVQYGRTVVEAAITLLTLEHPDESESLLDTLTRFLNFRLDRDPLIQ